jgi:lysyl-tRNA synthetase class 2
MLDLIADRNPGLDVDDEVQLRAMADELGAVPRERDWGELIYEIFERSVEKTLVQPTFVTGFPVSVSPLARRRADDPRLVERFELFIAGGEYANAFAELTDPLDQRSRFEQQLRAQAAGDEETHPMDEEFIAALEQGMPPAGGMGMGVDRLVMLLAGVGHIREVLTFPLMRDKPTGVTDWPEDA